MSINVPDLSPRTTGRAGRGAARRHPIIDVFGPTIQGEGPDAGTPCYFVRFGGCDFRCSWCDTMEAVDPERVREGADRMTAAEIVRRISKLAGAAKLVVLSGGNPALHRAEDLDARLKALAFRTSVETQGSIWREWLGMVDRLIISLKPPSSGMDTILHQVKARQFMERAAELHGEAGTAALKIPIFDEADYDWAMNRHILYPWLPCFFSVGNALPPGSDADDRTVKDGVLASYRWLCEKVANDPRAADVRVMPQLHLLAWGNERCR